MHRNSDDDADEDDWNDDESDLEDGDDEPTVPCPYCRREMLEDSPRCPACGNYISAEDSVLSGRPAWVYVTALVCLVIAVGWALALL